MYCRPETPGQCRVCAGPCGAWKGSIHRWTCADCLSAYVAEGAERADARARADREKARQKTARCLDNAPSFNKRAPLLVTA